LDQGEGELKQGRGEDWIKKRIYHGKVVFCRDLPKSFSKT